MEILILTLIGIIVGFIGGLLGGGADVLIVPLLLFFGITSNIKTAIDNITSTKHKIEQG